MSFFLNTEIKSTSLLENVGNFCFTPVRSLFEGKTYHRIDKAFLSQEPKEKSHIIVKIIKVVIATLFLLPGLVLGVFFKGLSQIQPSVREANNDFKNVQATSAFRRVLIEGQTSLINLGGNPQEFNPTFKKKNPYEWLEKNVSSPRKIDLKGLKAHVAERIFKMRLDFNSLTELDISDTGLVEQQIISIIKKCPNLRILKAEGAVITQGALALINSTCQTLSEESKVRLLAQMV